VSRIILLLSAVIATAAGADQTDRSVQTPVFTGRAELTVLNVVVTNRSGRFVADLPREAFTVYEDRQVQPIELFSSEDAPATIGLLIDGSASMHARRDLVSAAVGTFAATSNPEDEIFALTFADTVRRALPSGQEFESDPALLAVSLRAALRAHGRTALYDAVLDGLMYLDRGHHLRRVLVVVSDGVDNASSASFEQVAHAAAASNTVIYGVAIVDSAGHEGGPDRLEALADLTGGMVQAPDRASAVQRALERTARDIRSSYTVGYVPPQQTSASRRIEVTVRTSGGERLRARTRREYVRPEERTP
jgi:Ca-activated chloride channel family protein